LGVPLMRKSVNWCSYYGFKQEKSPFIAQSKFVLQHDRQPFQDRLAGGEPKIGLKQLPFSNADQLPVVRKERFVCPIMESTDHRLSDGKKRNQFPQHTERLV